MTTILITFTLDEGLGMRSRTIHDFDGTIEDAARSLQDELDAEGEYILVDPTAIISQRSTASLSFVSKLAIAAIDIEINPCGGLQ